MKNDMTFVSKGWGFERWIVNNEKEGYCGKLLYFAKGRKCSLHYHSQKHETFYVQSGKVHIYYSEQKPSEVKSSPNIYLMLDHVVLGPGDKFVVPRGVSHQIVAICDSEIFEFSTTHYDEDSYRIIKGD